MGITSCRTRRGQGGQERATRQEQDAGCRRRGVRVGYRGDRSLICEVADGSGVSPRLRRAHGEDESGRGLYLVAQLASRWGTRFTRDGGKVIWAELTTRGGAAG